MTGLVVIVEVAGRRAALRTAEVQSVVELETISPVPRAPAFVLGLTALRSSTLTVVDAAAAIGLMKGDSFIGSHGLGAGGHTHGDNPYRVSGVLAPCGCVLDRLLLTATESVWRVHEKALATDEEDRKALEAHREVTLALFELRLEVARRPELMPAFRDWQRAAFDADVAFNEAAGLPGGRREIALFHYAIEGLVFDRLTSPLDPETGTDEIVDALVEGLIDGTRVTGSRRTPSR